jgi:hypothetical protein
MKSGGPDDRTVFDIFGVGEDRQMYRMIVEAGQWPPKTSGWQPAGGCLASPAAVARDKRPSGKNLTLRSKQPGLVLEVGFACQLPMPAVKAQAMGSTFVVRL